MNNVLDLKRAFSPKLTFVNPSWFSLPSLLGGMYSVFLAGFQGLAIVVSVGDKRCGFASANDVVNQNTKDIFKTLCIFLEYSTVSFVGVMRIL